MTLVPTRALWPLPWLIEMRDGGPTLPVAVNVMVTFGTAALVAISVLAPGTLPSVQLPTVATPLDPVVTVPPVRLPPPEVTANVTVAPATTAPLEFFTSTLGNVVTAAPAVPVWLVEETASIDAGVVFTTGGGGGVTSPPPPPQPVRANDTPKSRIEARIVPFGAPPSTAITHRGWVPATGETIRTHLFRVNTQLGSSRAQRGTCTNPEVQVPR